MEVNAMKKNMTGKSRMLVVGIVLGAAGAALLAALIAGGKLGWIGLCCGQAFL